jgi:chemotaxis methyl-accepting protein methylase
MVRVDTINNHNLCFKSYFNPIKNKAGLVINRGDTCLFRHDLDFDYFVDFLERKYKNTDKVNIIAHACSDGEEAYSLVYMMIKILGKDGAAKFLPIDARDIEKKHLTCAKKGLYNVDSTEFSRIEFFAGRDFYNYFDLLNVFNKISVRENIKDLVKFSNRNIMDDIKTLRFDNTVLLARNFWHYLELDDIYRLALNLSNKMNKSSTLVIGNYDKEYGVHKVLERYGFEEVPGINNVFEKYM